MTTDPGSKFRAAFSMWIRLLAQMWKPFVWVWITIIVGIGINVVSSWLTTQTTSFTLHGTPLGWVVDSAHLGITLPLIGALIFLTCLAGLAHHQADIPAVEAEQSLMFTSQQRLQLLRSFQQEYGNRLGSSLQGRVAIELGLHERTDVIASSAQLVFHHTDTATEYPLPPGTSIIQVYDNAQRGLLILGAPGSGKTTLLLDLVMELLQRAESDPDHPIPIILNLSSWATRKQAFSDWLKEQLSLVYGIPKRLSTLWITSEQVIFLFDGLDEVENSARSTCIDAVNSYRREHLVPLVVCSRSWEYENQQERLNLPTAVEIQPLELVHVTTYLKQAGKSLAAVRTVLQNNTALRQILTTPLMLSIVILTYRDKTVKDLPQKGSTDEQQHYIFEHYVQRMFERHQELGRLSKSRILSTLTWLAQQMQRRHLTEFYLEQIQLDWFFAKNAFTQLFFSNEIIVGQWLHIKTSGLNIELAEQVTFLWRRISIWLSIGLLGGFFIGLFGPFGLLKSLVFGSLCGLLLGLIGQESNQIRIELFFWPLKKLKVSMSIAFPPPSGGGGLSVTQIDTRLRNKPAQGIYNSGWNAIRLGMIFLILGGLLGELLGGFFFGLAVGLFCGFIFGLSFGGLAYLQHYQIRFFLALSGVLPWHTIMLLEEATTYILLQRVGGGYRFIHPLLQEYFASL